MKIHMSLLAIAGLLASPASAQLSITTFGATDAALCYQHANDDLASETMPCDMALKDSGTTRLDRKKTYVNRGIIHNRNQALALAFADFDAALMIDGELAEAYLNRGNSWFASGDHEHAKTDYERALEHEVAQPWAAWYNIGLVHTARKEHEDARIAYARALALKPDFELAKKKLEKQ